MSGEYRDELSAAHSRIAELEEKVRGLEDEARPSNRFATPGRFPELEAKVAAYAAGADHVTSAKRRVRIAWISAIFPFLGMLFTFMHMPLFATACSVGFIALVIVNLRIISTRTKYAARHQEALRELTQAQHVAELESKLAEATRVRVGSESVQSAASSAIAEESDEAQEPLRADRI